MSRFPHRIFFQPLPVLFVLCFVFVRVCPSNPEHFSHSLRTDRTALSSPTPRTPFEFVQIVSLNNVSVSNEAQLRFAQQMARGISLAFEQVNREMGGVFGRNLTLTVISANHTAADYSDVLAFVGVVCSYSTACIPTTGTSTSGIPIIGKVVFEDPPAFERDSLLTRDEDVVYIRPSVADEVHAVVDYLTRVRRLVNVAAVFTNDSMGIATFAIVKRAFETIRLGLVSFACYYHPVAAAGLNINFTNTIANQELPLPQAVILLVPATDLASLLSLFRQSLPSTTLYFALSSPDISDVGASNTIPAAALDGLFLSHAVPPLSSTYLTSLNSFLATTPSQQLDHDVVPDSPFIEGYLTGMAVARLLQRVTSLQTVSWQSLVDAIFIPSSPIDLNGLQMGPFAQASNGDLGNGCSQGLRQVWLTRVNGALVPTFETVDYEFVFPKGSCASDVDQLQKFIVYGQTVALSGPSAQTGLAIANGLLAAFEEQNANGGIYGHQLVLLSLDDRYEPGPAYANAFYFLSQRNVHGIVGTWGSITTQAVAELVTAYRTPLIGPYSGAMFLRQPFNRFFVNLRASYEDEAVAIVDFLTQKKLVTRFSLLYQDDLYGMSGYRGLNRSLAAIGLSILSAGSYPRNTDEVESALTDIVRKAYPQEPQAIVMFCVAGVVEKFINLALQVFPPTTVFIVPSPGITDQNVSGVSNDYGNMFATQVVPPYWDNSTQFITQYQSSLRTFTSVLPSLISFEYYMVGRLIVTALQRTDPSLLLDRTAFLDSVYTSSVFPLGDVVVGPYTKCCNQGLQNVWMSQLSKTSSIQTIVPDYSFSFRGLCFGPTTALRPPFVFGLSITLSGPFADTGIRFRDGLLAAFHYLNAQGGVNGHMLSLLVLDDRNDPIVAANNTRHLIDDERAFGVFGGRSTAIASLMLAKCLQSEVPFIGPMIGDVTLRSQFYRSLIHLRASVNDEVMAIVDYLVNKRGMTQLAVFSSACVLSTPEKCPFISAVSLALASFGISILSYGADLISIFPNGRGWGGPQAVMMEGDAESLVSFVRDSRAYGHMIEFYTVSGVGPEAFQQTVLKHKLNTQDIFVSQVVPLPDYAQLNPGKRASLGVEDFTAALLSLNATLFPGVSSFEGYLLGRLVFAALDNIHIRAYTKDVLIDSFYRTAIFDIDDLVVGPYLDSSCRQDNQSHQCTCNQGMHFVWLTMLGPNDTVPFTYVGTDASDSYFAFSTCGVVFTPVVKAKGVGLTSINLVALITPFAAVLLCGLVILAWRMSANYRRIRRLHSNETIAIKCAEAIAILQFDDVAFLETLIAPNRIQQAFIRIINILSYVKKHVPDTILTQLAQTSSQLAETDSLSLLSTTSKPLLEFPLSPDHRTHSSTMEHAPFCRGVPSSDPSTVLTSPKCPLQQPLFMSPMPCSNALPVCPSTEPLQPLPQRRSNPLDGSPRLYPNHFSSNSPLPRQHRRHTHQPQHPAAHQRSKSISVPGRFNHHNRGWHRRRVCALYITYHFGQFDESATGNGTGGNLELEAPGGSFGPNHEELLESGYRIVLDSLVPIVKKHGGVFESITPSAATALWGAFVSRGSGTDGTQFACEAAIELAQTFESQIDPSEIQLCMLISNGICAVGEVSTEEKGISLVVGSHLLRLPRLVDRRIYEKLNLQILVDLLTYEITQHLFSFRTAVTMKPANNSEPRTVLYQLFSQPNELCLPALNSSLNWSSEPPSVPQLPSPGLLAPFSTVSPPLPPTLPPWATLAPDLAQSFPPRKENAYEVAFALFLRGEYRLALPMVSAHLQSHPHDLLARHLLEEIQLGVGVAGGRSGLSLCSSGDSSVASGSVATESAVTSISAADLGQSTTNSPPRHQQQPSQPQPPHQPQPFLQSPPEHPAKPFTAASISNFVLPTTGTGANGPPLTATGGMITTPRHITAIMAAPPLAVPAPGSAEFCLCEESVQAEGFSAVGGTLSIIPR